MDRHELQRSFKDKIDDAFKKIQELENKRDEVSGKTKDKLEKEIESLKSKRKKMEDQYESLKNSTEEKIDEINVQFEKSLANFEQGFKEISKAFSS